MWRHLSSQAANQWRSQYSGKGAKCPLDSEKNVKKSGKIGENRKKEKKKRKNRDEKAKIGKVLSLCPY